jgi:phosphoglycerol transferase MdoB-like AlkP superfamily enzyme
MTVVPGGSDAPRSTSDSEFAVAYAYLQQVVGVIALTLPFVLIVGNRLLGGDLEGSISAYYYTHMGSYFVGSLFALGVFFLSYQHRPLPGFEWDNRLANAATLMAVGVALFPTTSDAATASTGAKTVGVVHLVCAAALFTLLGVFSLVFFTKSHDRQMTVRKRQRNLVYRACGSIIFVAIVSVIATEIVKPPSSWHTFLWLETVMVVAFGLSWLIKGGFLHLLADSASR